MKRISGNAGELESELSAPAEFVQQVEEVKRAKSFDEIVGAYIRARLSDRAQRFVPIEEVVEEVRKNINPQLVTTIWKLKTQSADG